ncbi:MFS transporter [Actinokineospora auranticolor]|uniref:EmrB/QacA subfamily drug resistance transporter n=1 Tax=Actinokineospora auranticolor TaxID=155976 RepID=A0A2S6GYF8_9PSEU|nr:MFS transporter [Actinokineospora auranticolor]PPK70207.1 EmrB/QacA subfamily drug resistance transporter [Actinokineospora auranticolor]
MTTTVPRAAVERGKMLTLVVLCAAMFLDALDTSLVAVALPGIQDDLGMSTGAAQWLISGYTVTYGGFLLLGGRLADLFGKRRMFLVSMVLFAVASLVGGLVSDPGLLIASRLAKGIAAALTAPAALSLITTRFHEGPERNRALAFYSATAASGYSLGLVFSGLLTALSWRLIFFMPVLISVLVIVATPFVIKEPKLARAKRSYDIAGAFAATFGILALVYGMVHAAERGWTDPMTLATLGGAVVLLVAFVFIERGGKDPTVPMRVFRSWTRSSAYLLALAFGCASLGWQFVATLYMQHFLHYSALQTALAMLPLGIVILLVAQFITSRLLSRVPARRIAGIGFLIQGAGIFVFTFVGVVGNYPGLMLPGLLLHAIGNGLVFPTINVAGVSGVDDEEQGVASGLVTAALQVGVGVGVAIVSGVLTMATVGDGPEAQVAGYSAAFLTATCFSVVAAVIGFVGLRCGIGVPTDGGTERTAEPGQVAPAPVAGA